VYKQLAWDEEGTQAAFLADRDTSKSKQRFFALYYCNRAVIRQPCSPIRPW